MSTPEELMLNAFLNGDVTMIETLLKSDLTLPVHAVPASTAAKFCGKSPGAFAMDRSRGNPHPPAIKLERSISYRVCDLIDFQRRRSGRAAA